MWIQAPENWVQVAPDFLDEPVDFTCNGKANVPQEIGEQLTEHYDNINQINND